MEKNGIGRERSLLGGGGGGGAEVPFSLGETLGSGAREGRGACIASRDNLRFVVCAHPSILLLHKRFDFRGISMGYNDPSLLFRLGLEWAVEHVLYNWTEERWCTVACHALD